MTAVARITQADIERAIKAVRKSGCERARVLLGLEKATIEIIIEQPSSELADSGGEQEEWSDDDV